MFLYIVFLFVGWSTSLSLPASRRSFIKYPALETSTTNNNLLSLFNVFQQLSELNLTRGRGGNTDRHGGDPVGKWDGTFCQYIRCPSKLKKCSVRILKEKKNMKNMLWIVGWKKYRKRYFYLPEMIPLTWVLPNILGWIFGLGHKDHFEKLPFNLLIPGSPFSHLPLSFNSLC